MQWQGHDPVGNVKIALDAPTNGQSELTVKAGTAVYLVMLNIPQSVTVGYVHIMVTRYFTKLSSEIY